MDTINSLCAIVQGMLSAGIVMRIVFCAVRLTHEEEEMGRYKKRIRNCIIILIITQLIFPIKDLIVYYLGKGY